jgi:hypothetical protein
MFISFGKFEYEFYTYSGFSCKIYSPSEIWQLISGSRWSDGKAMNTKVTAIIPLRPTMGHL